MDDDFDGFIELPKKTLYIWVDTICMIKKFINKCNTNKSFIQSLNSALDKLAIEIKNYTKGGNNG